MTRQMETMINRKPNVFSINCRAGGDNTLIETREGTVGGREVGTSVAYAAN